MKLITGQYLVPVFNSWVEAAGPMLPIPEPSYPYYRMGFMRFLPGMPPLPLYIERLGFHQGWELPDDAHALVMLLHNNPHAHTLIKARTIQLYLRKHPKYLVSIARRGYAP